MAPSWMRFISSTRLNSCRRCVPHTLAKELSLYVVLYSPVQMAADLPENYLKQPDALRFIRDVAVDWDESIALAGEVGDFVAIARKQRGAPDWFVGALTDEQPRSLTLPHPSTGERARFVAPWPEELAKVLELPPGV